MAKKMFKKYVILLILVNLTCVHKGIMDKNFFQVEGSVSYKDSVLQDATVEIYSENDIFKNGFKDSPFTNYKIKGSDGRFSVKLPAGNYYFAAYKSGDGKRQSLKEGDSYCFYGGNPVSVFGDKKGLSLNCVKIYNLQKSFSFLPDGSELSGEVVDVEGNALEGAYIYLFQASNPDLRRMADIVSKPTKEDGSFSFVVKAAGSYFIVARKRQNIQDRGPLKVGDYYGYYHDNPVEIKEKTKMFLKLECSEKKREEEPANFAAIPAGKSGIRGKLIDKDGKPVKNMFAFVYKDEFNTGKKPDYKSLVTKEDGVYTIIIENPGLYIIGARSTYGGPPEPGDVFGFYKGPQYYEIDPGDVFGFHTGAQNYKIKIEKGEIKENVNILVEEIR
ncbi:MAG: carboxypeptidase-like regulatory domain-containing protein [bacterium]